MIASLWPTCYENLRELLALSPVCGVTKRRGEGMRSSKVRYAVVGLGHIAQVAVLPAFEHATGGLPLAL